MPAQPMMMGTTPTFQQVPMQMPQQFSGFGMQQPAGQGTMQGATQRAMPAMPPVQGTWPGTMQTGMNMGQGHFM